MLGENDSFPLEIDRRRRQVRVPEWGVSVISMYIGFETNLHKVFHGLGVVGVPIHVVLFPLDRNCSSRFYKPACKSPASKLGCLRGQSKHVALLPKVQGCPSPRLGKLTFVGMVVTRSLTGAVRKDRKL